MTVHRLRLRSARPRRAVAARAQNPAHRHRRGPGLVISRLASDRGDVPGWVMITLMTAAIVVALWAVASEQIVQIFNNAMAPFLNGEL